MAEPIIIKSQSLSDQIRPGVQALLGMLQERQQRLAQQQSLAFRQQQFAALQQERAAAERQRMFTNALKMVELTGDFSILETPGASEALASQGIDIKNVRRAYDARRNARSQRFKNYSTVLQGRFRDPELKTAVGQFVSMLENGEIDQTTFRDSLDDLMERTGDVSDEQAALMQRMYPRLFALLPHDQAVAAVIETEIKLAGKQALQDAGLEAAAVSLSRVEREYEAALAAAYRRSYDKATNTVDREAFEAAVEQIDAAYSSAMPEGRLQYVKNLTFTEFANRTIVNQGLRDEIMRGILGGSGMIPGGGVFGPEGQQQGQGQPVAIPGLSEQEQNVMSITVDQWLEAYSQLTDEEKQEVDKIAEQIVTDPRYGEMPDSIVQQLVPRLALQQYLDERSAIVIEDTPTGPRVGISYTPEEQ